MEYLLLAILFYILFLTIWNTNVFCMYRLAVTVSLRPVCEVSVVCSNIYRRKKTGTNK